MELPFIKYEVNGNGLILVDGRARRIEDLSTLAIKLCAHHTGAGSDGLLAVQLAPEGLPLMRMFNPDGTEDFCGNGLLCTMAYLYEKGESRAGTMDILSPAGRHDGRVRPARSDRYAVTGDVLKPRFEPQDIPVKLPGRQILDEPKEIGGRTFPISCVNVGTTHTVIYSDHDVPEGTFREISPLLETHKAFPERTSVLWCRVEGRDRIWMRIWERGVGETFACGTGACAALAVAASTGRAGRKAVVSSRGGKVTVEWPTGRSVRITAEVHKVYSGKYLPS